MRTVLLTVLGCTCLAVACQTEPAVSNTGYSGTWTRGNERARSVVSIWPDGDGYRFRVGMTTDDDSRTLECDWEGHCSEVVKGRLIREHQFRTRLDPDTGHLLVECEVRGAENGEVALQYVDELVVAPDGLILDVFTIEQDGETQERGRGGKRTFQKISDKVASPP